MYRFFFVCFVFLAPAFYGSPAKAGPVQDAIAAANSRDYEGAVSILRRAAVAGDVPSQSHLGAVLYFGWWTKPDRDEGLRWLRAAANRNDLKAQLVLARETKDRAEALNWYEKAALNGDPVAQERVGRAYWWGAGRPRDVKASIEWFQKAAAAGHPDAQLLLGVQYAIGQVIPRDLRQARHWFSELAGSSALNARTAQEYLATFYEKGLGGPQNYSEALRWYEAAVKGGHAPYAEFSLGAMYEFGRGVPANLDKALDLYRTAAFRQYRPAQYRLGVAYLRGEGVRRDLAEALKWLAFSVNWDLIDNVAPAVDKSVRSQFERDPELFQVLTGQLRPAAFDYAVTTVRDLAKVPGLYSQAKGLAAAFQPTPPPPPILIH
ncbi:tetratricopeptide repeat protein [Reyranella sp.]|uniref:tetratricopeptide repeat protein n=1 Tax=Reyranella sp. TaxID=1929291 RepID=UPI004036C264